MVFDLCLTLFWVWWLYLELVGFVVHGFLDVVLVFTVWVCLRWCLVELAV